MYTLTTVRARWTTLLGTFVAICLAVTVMASAILVVNAVGTNSAAMSRADRERLDGAASLMGMSAMLAAFVSIFVVASTMALAVDQRRREFALMRAVGATGRQVRRSVLREAFVVGVLAAVVGAVDGLGLAMLLAGWLRRVGVVPAGFTVRFQLWPVVFAMVTGLVVALLGAWLASRRAGKVRPAEALREAAVQRRTMTVGRWLFGSLFLAGGIAMIVYAPGVDATLGILMTLFVAEIFIVAFALLAPVLIPPLVRLAPLPGVTGLLVREGSLAAIRRTASTAAPVLVTVGIAASLIGAVDTLNAAQDAELRQRLTADTVVVPRDRPGLSDADVDAVRRARPGATVSATLATRVRAVAGRDNDLGPEAHGVDPETLPQVMNLTVRSGSLAELRGPRTAAVPADLASDFGLRTGSTIRITYPDGVTEPTRVVAIVATPPHLAELLLPMQSVRAHGRGALADAIYVRGPGSGPAVAGSATLDKAGFAAARSEENARVGRFVLMVLLGLSLTFTMVSIANTLLMATADRARDIALLRLSGATPMQVVRAFLAETTLVVLVGAALATVTTWLCLQSLAAVLSRAMGAVDAQLPWTAIGIITAICLAVALAAAAAPTLLLLRRPPRAAA